MEVARAYGGRRIIYEAAALVPILGSHILEKGTISLWLAEVSSDECSGPMNFLPQVASEAVSVGSPNCLSERPLRVRVDLVPELHPCWVLVLLNP